MIQKSMMISGFVAALALVAAPMAMALHSPQHYELFGNAEHISPGNASDRAVELVSDLAEADPFGGIDYGVEEGMTLADLTYLGTEYNVTDDDCAGGSPRFQLNMDTDGDGDADGNIFVHIGPSPNFTNCVPGWQDTGNLIGNNDAGRYDSSQVGGSTFGTYDDAIAAAGDDAVVGIQLVVDSGWAFADQEQTIWIDNTMINDTLFTYELPVPADKNACKQGGWQNLTDDEGTPFKNQGDCVSYVATDGKNKADGA